jgi:aminoglycoside/choline kinase family phosphotransferase
MQGFLGYDLVSLIFQAKANLPKTWQKQLKDYYANYFIEKGLISTKQFDVQYNYSLILRFLQLLGAYGLRGLVEKKPHFLESIVHHYKNLEILLDKNLLDNYSETKKIIQFIVSVEGKKHINQLFQNNKIS